VGVAKRDGRLFTLYINAEEKLFGAIWYVHQRDFLKHIYGYDSGK